MKNQSGITLVALLLVMLLLIILAGISISLVVTSDQKQQTVKTPVVTELPPSVGELPSEELEENIENTVETENIVEE